MKKSPVVHAELLILVLIICLNDMLIVPHGMGVNSLLADTCIKLGADEQPLMNCVAMQGGAHAQPPDLSSSHRDMTPQTDSYLEIGYQS